MWPLPIGRYQLKVTAADGSAPALVPEGVRELLPPIRSHVSGMYARLETGPRASLNLVVEAPLAPEERGARNQERLRQAHINRVPSVRPNTVLLRTYYGESCTDTALAVHHELRRRGGYELYWTVKDHSVIVPEADPGGVELRAVVRALGLGAVHDRQHARAGLLPQRLPGRSRRRRSTATRSRRPGMLDWRDRSSRRGDRVQVYLTRRRRGLPRAAGRLREADCRRIPYDRVHPRVTATPATTCCSPREAAQIRERARRILGLPADARARRTPRPPRYSPRPSSSRRWSSSSTRRLDRLESLGPSLVVLVRGHNMNMRPYGL